MSAHRLVRLALSRPKGATCGGCEHWLRAADGPAGRCFSLESKGDNGSNLYGAERPANAVACRAWSGS